MSHETEGPWRVDYTDDNRGWASNVERFDTKEEAEDRAVQKSWSWLTLRGYRIVPSDHPQREEVDYAATADAGFICRDLS